MTPTKMYCFTYLLQTKAWLLLCVEQVLIDFSNSVMQDLSGRISFLAAYAVDGLFILTV